MPRTLGPGGIIRITEGDKKFWLKLMTSSGFTGSAAQTSERRYRYPKVNPPKTRTTPGGGGTARATFDNNAGAAVRSLRRQKGKTTTIEYVSDLVDEIAAGKTNSELAIAAPAGSGTDEEQTFGKVTASGSAKIDFTTSSIDSGDFIVIDNKAYEIERIIDADTAFVDYVGPVAANVATELDDFADAPAVAATETWSIVAPAEVYEVTGTVSQIGDITDGEEATDNNLEFGYTDDPTVRFWLTEAQNAPADAR